MLRDLLQRAGVEATKRFLHAEPSRKADGSVVTDADLAAEAVLVEGLQRECPDDGIVGEEGALVVGRSGVTWHLDPIDGTASFVQGLASWGPTVCAVDDAGLRTGAFFMPRLQEYWVGERGEGAWRDGTPLQPLDWDAPTSRDVLFAPSRFHLAKGVPWPGKIRALGSSAAHLAYVAGRAGSIAVIPRWNLWDIGCGVVMIRELGGGVFDIDGTSVEPEKGPVGLPLLVGASSHVALLTDDGWARRAFRAKQGRGNP